MPKTIVHARKSKPSRSSKRRATAPAQQPVEQETDAASRRKAEIGDRLVLDSLSDYERTFLAVCQQIFRNDRGCITPFEEFIGKLIGDVKRGRWPTPEDVRGYLDTFERDWKDMRRKAAQFIERYPESAERPMHAAAEIVLRHMRNIPPEMLEAMPTDGASQHDHYIYGWPKREE